MGVCGRGTLLRYAKTLNSFRDLSVRTVGHGKIDSTIDPDQNMYTILRRNRFLLFVTYFPKNLINPFNLRVTGINCNTDV